MWDIQNVRGTFKMYVGHSKRTWDTMPVVHTQVGDQWNIHWSSTCVSTHPEPGADPPGVYMYYLAGTRPAFFPPGKPWEGFQSIGNGNNKEHPPPPTPDVVRRAYLNRFSRLCTSCYIHHLHIIVCTSLC